MEKVFLIKNRFKKNLGRIIYSRGKFKVEVFLKEDQEFLEELLNRLVKEGIVDLGEIILKKPIKLGHPLFLNEVRNQLARRGYILIEKRN